jgi:hypothetical protein
VDDRQQQELLERIEIAIETVVSTITTTGYFAARLRRDASRSPSHATLPRSRRTAR